MELKLTGLGFSGILAMVLGLVLIIGGLALGIVYGLVTGSMVLLLVGIALVVEAFLLKG